MPKKFEGLVKGGDFDPLLEDLKAGQRSPAPAKRSQPPKPAKAKPKASEPVRSEEVVELTPSTPAVKLEPKAKTPPKSSEPEPTPASQASSRKGERLPTRTAEFDPDFNRELTYCLQRIGQKVGLTNGLPYNVAARIAASAIQHAESEILEELGRSGALAAELGNRPANKDKAALAEWEDLWTKTVFTAWRRMRPWT